MTIKLSEAIIIGMTKNPQAFEQFKNWLTGGTCALGAAMEGAGFNLKINCPTPSSVFPYSLKIIDNCPVCQDSFLFKNAPLLSLIIHLNDQHRWPRGKIAQWVKTIEDAEEAKAPVTLNAPAAVEEEARAPQEEAVLV